LTSPRADQSATSLTARWFVGELSRYLYDALLDSDTSLGFQLFQLFCLIGNSADKLHHTRSVAYSVELVLNENQISGGGAYLDCYRLIF